MYSKLSDSLVIVADGIVLATMSDEEAKKTLQTMTPELAKMVSEALKSLKPQVEQGRPIVVTAAISGPAKAFLMALLTLAPAVFANPSAIDDLSMKLRTKPISIEEVMKVNDVAEKGVQTENQAKIDGLKNVLKEKGGEAVESNKVFMIGDKKFMAANQKQEKVLQTLTNMAKGFAMHRSQGIISPEQFKTLMAQAFDTLATGGIRPMGHDA
jgi:hypothetical protein